MALTTLAFAVLCAASACDAAAEHAAQRPSFAAPNDFGVGVGLATLAAKAGGDWRKVAEGSRSTGRIHQFRALFRLGAVRKLMHPEIFPR